MKGFNGSIGIMVVGIRTGGAQSTDYFYWIKITVKLFESNFVVSNLSFTFNHSGLIYPQFYY